MNGDRERGKGKGDTNERGDTKLRRQGTHMLMRRKVRGVRNVIGSDRGILEGKQMIRRLLSHWDHVSEDPIVTHANNACGLRGLLKPRIPGDSAMVNRWTDLCSGDFQRYLRTVAM
jgi:hypothetical protein